MMFWDTSAIIPLIVNQDFSKELTEAVKLDPVVIVWWGTLVEAHSALTRLAKEKILNKKGYLMSVERLRKMQMGWIEILPGNDLRLQAIRMVTLHELRALDSLQLAAAMISTNLKPVQSVFVCLDEKLRTAAEKESFSLLPEK